MTSVTFPSKKLNKFNIIIMLIYTELLLLFAGFSYGYCNSVRNKTTSCMETYDLYR